MTKPDSTPPLTALRVQFTLPRNSSAISCCSNNSSNSSRHSSSNNSRNHSSNNMSYNDHWKWYSLYVTSSMLSNIGHGLIIAAVGPTQPYLAKNVGVNIDLINFVWTFGFVGYLLGSLACGMIFKRYFTTSRAKLSFIFFAIGINGILMCVLPYLANFGVLVTVRMVQNFSLGGFITADASMLVYTMGPVRSRPFTNALHAAVGVGFFLSSWVIRPFLPSDDKSTEDREAVCNMNKTERVMTVGAGEGMEEGLSAIVYPFLISGVFCVVVSFGYLILGFLPMTMPRFYEDQQQQNSDMDMDKSSDKKESNELQQQEVTTKVKHWIVMLVFVFVYYFLSCGIERIYQPMAYTLGYCGPLQLPSSEAVLIDSTYNGGFLAGRLVSIVVAIFIRPRNMIIASCGACVTAAALLCAFGGVDKYGLYTGTAMLGFFVSWQFGSCFSFVAQKMDITGRLSPLFFIGCGIGSAVFPPLSGYAFTSEWGGPDSILYLTLAACILQCFIFSTIWLLSRTRTVVAVGA